MKIELWGIDKPKPYEQNPRKCPESAIAKVAQSIQEYGFRQPIIVDKDGVIIAGHTRLLASERLGLKKVPVHVADLTPEQARAYRLADNRVAQETDWDHDLLKMELGDLKELDFDLELTGFDMPELNRLLTDEEEIARAEETPETPVNPVTVTGDVWLLGNHRIICGDATSATDVERVLNGVKPHLMITDPPYGVEYSANWRREARDRNGNPISSQSLGRAVGAVENDGRDDWREAWALFPGDVAYVWHAGNKAHEVAESIEACDFDIRAQLIWRKHRFVISRGNYHGGHEPCWYAVKKNRKAHWTGDRKQSTVWDIEHQASETGHSTQKPIEAMRRPILNNSKPGDAIYDPFLGSGTTLIAAEMEGRHCYGLELHSPYVDVIIKRWQDYTGQQATHAETGQTFEQLCEERFDSADNSKRCYDEAIDTLREEHERGREQGRAPSVRA